MIDVQVIGAGISGLVAAWRLKELGCQVTVREASSEAGGLARSFRAPEGLVERGPTSMRWTDTTERWFAKLGIEPAFPHKVHRRRYVYRDGRARRWPLSPSETIEAGARLARAKVTRSLAPRPDEAVSDFVARVASRAATDWLVGPMLQGIYAAPPERLSAEAVFGARKQKSRGMVAPRAGMAAFVERLLERLRKDGVRFEWNTPVTAVERGRPTFICANAPAAARLLQPHAAELAKAIGRVAMSDAASVTAFYEREPADLQGFGVLLPDADGFRALGAVFNDCLFEGRSQMRSETWIFGSRSGDLSEGELEGVVAAERERITGRRANAVAMYATKYRQALPIYDTAILEVKATLTELPPWLAVSGNYLGRIGLADLIQQAEAGASELVRKLHGTRMKQSA